jgi:hypothetical protein
MGKINYDGDDFNWEEIERVAKNFKGSSEEMEEIFLDELPVKKKKKSNLGKFYTDD